MRGVVGLVVVEATTQATETQSGRGGSHHGYQVECVEY